ncbi:MAG: hypothetical protein LUH10_13090 [Tannerellaceae bacterium]|nr:hypothetical protein [Tannerellaceae bacterium]
MKTHTYINTLYKTVILLLITTVFNACVDDDWGRECTPTGDIRITLTLQLPGTVSRATAEQESRIDEIEVLLFKPDDGAFVGSYTAENITTNPDYPNDNSRRRFTVKVIEGKFDIMLLANSKDIIDNAGLARDMSRSEVARRLTLPQGGKVAHDGSVLIPFWGELKGANIVNGSTLGEITLLRAMAKIDLLIDEDLKADFKLQTVTLYHWQKEMALLPDPAHYKEAEEKVTAATETGSKLTPEATKATYTAGAGEIEGEEQIVSKIYLNETPNPGPDRFPEMPCLVIGGEYKGQLCYYRIDFYKEDDNGNHIYHDILRNHWYELTIINILREGLPSIEDAYKSVDMHLDIEVMEWNESDMSNIIIEGKYFLKVNESNFKLDREPHDQDSYHNKLTIETNHEDGWVIDRITEPGDGAPLDMDNGWIRIVPEERAGPVDETTISILLEENNTGAPRSAEIHLQVGRLIDFIVTVTQDVVWNLELFIEDLDGNPLEELMFYDYYGKDTPHEPKAFRVRWAPYGADSRNPGRNFECRIRTTAVGNDHFDYKSGPGYITTGVLTDATGSKEYIIEPKPFTEEQVNERVGNPFLQHASWVTFTVTDPADESKSVSKTILLNHQHIAIVSRDFRRLSYLDREYKFKVLANTPWVIETIEPGEDGFTITNYTSKDITGGNDIVSGDQLTYTTSPKSNNGFNQAGRKATFYLRDLRGIIPDRVPFTISAVYEDPNCYMVTPSSGPISIPIRKLFWIREREAGDASVVDILEDPSSLDPCIVWEEYYDEQTGNPAAGSVTFKIESAPNALDAQLKVTIPSGVIGNALVGVKRKNENNILWSWHIWITDYNPEANGGSLETAEARFMYRNLGALSGEQTVNDHTVGLYYQWGRKDPLRPKEIPTKQQSPSLNNLIHAINAPDIFFTGGSLQDWYTSSKNRGYQNDFLWAEYDDNHKSQYDPCPDGWRVPNLGDGESLATSLWRLFKREDVVQENDDLLGILMRTLPPSPADILFLPAGGYYDHEGFLEHYKEFATAYNANTGPDKVNEHKGLHITQSYGGGSPEQPIERAAAMPVRCIKRTKP